MTYDPKKYWEKRSSHWIGGIYETVEDMEALEEWLKPDMPTWDIGCGQGRWSPFFDEYVGSDISLKLVNHCKKAYPEDTFFTWDIRKGVPKRGHAGTDFDFENAQIFAYTVLLHVPPEDIIKIKFPDTARLVFVEPFEDSKVAHCFRHAYGEIFGATAVGTYGRKAVWVREAK